MFIIYIYNQNNDPHIKIIDITNSFENARKIIKKNVNDFIIDHEGKLKLEISTINDETPLDKLKNGYYYIENEDKHKIILYNKITINEPNVTSSYWFSRENLHEIHKKNIVHEYVISEFKTDYLLKQIHEMDIKYNELLLEFENTKNELSDLTNDFNKMNLIYNTFDKKYNETCDEMQQLKINLMQVKYELKVVSEENKILKNKKEKNVHIPIKNNEKVEKKVSFDEIFTEMKKKGFKNILKNNNKKALFEEMHSRGFYNILKKVPSPDVNNVYMNKVKIE